MRGPGEAGGLSIGSLKTAARRSKYQGAKGRANGALRVGLSG